MCHPLQHPHEVIGAQKHQLNVMADKDLPALSRRRCIYSVIHKVFVHPEWDHTDLNEECSNISAERIIEKDIFYLSKCHSRFVTDLFLIISREFEVLWHGQFWFSPGTNFVGIRVAVLEHLRRAQASRTATYPSSNGRPKRMLAWIYLLPKASTTTSNFTGPGSVEAQIFCLKKKTQKTYRKHVENIEYILYKYVIPRMGGGVYIGEPLSQNVTVHTGFCFRHPLAKESIYSHL